MFLIYSQLDNITGDPNICVGSCHYDLSTLFDLFKKSFGEEFCSVINGCNLPLPPRKYYFKDHGFNFPDEFHWLMNPEIWEIMGGDYIEATAKFFSAADIELGCFNATMNYIRK